MVVSLATIANGTATSFDVVTVTATLAAGSTAPDSYQFSLVPNSDVHGLTLTGTGASRTYIAPGRFDGCSVQVLVEALVGGAVVASTTSTVVIGEHANFIWLAGQSRWVAVGPMRRLAVTNIGGGLLTESGQQITTESGAPITVG